MGVSSGIGKEGLLACDHIALWQLGRATRASNRHGWSPQQVIFVVLGTDLAVEQSRWQKYQRSGTCHIQ